MAGVAVVSPFGEPADARGTTGCGRRISRTAGLPGSFPICSVSDRTRRAEIGRGTSRGPAPHGSGRRPGHGSPGRRIQRRRCRVRGRDYLLQVLERVAAAVAVAWLAEWWTNLWPLVPTLVALLVLDRPVALRLVLLYVLGGVIAIFLFTAAGQLLRGTLNTAPLTNIFWAARQSRLDGFIPVRGHRPDQLAARARGDAARPGRYAAVRLRLDAVPRVVHSRVERRVVQSRVSHRRHVLVIRDAAVCAVHAREPSGGLAGMAAPERACGRIREQTIQRHPTGRRLLVGGRRRRGHRDLAVNDSWVSGNRRWRRRLSRISTCRGCGASRRSSAATGPTSAAASCVRVSGAHGVALRSRGTDMAAPGSSPAHRGRRSCDAHRRSRGRARAARRPPGRGLREDVARSG